MTYPFAGLFAIDPKSPSNVAANSAVTIFDPSDFTQTPIPLYDAGGLPLQNPLLSNEKGYIGVFHADIDEVGWSAGQLQGMLQSFAGLRQLAMDARADAQAATGDAQDAKEQARAAASLVQAPADQVVASMLSDKRTASSVAAREIVFSEITETRDAVNDAADPLAFLDQVKLICRFPVREADEKSWPQGFSINAIREEIYVANQNGPELRIDVRSLRTGERVESKAFITEGNAFTESLDWFYKDEDLCFVVWPKGGGSAPSAYAILNYTKQTMSPHIPILGFNRGSRDGEKFVTSDAWAYNVKKFYIYDWESVKSGAPTLLDTVPVSNAGATAAKNQGLASIAGHVFLSQGSQSEQPTLTAYKPNGQLADSRTYTRAAFMEALNALEPGILSDPGYLYEAEGATSLNGKLVTGHIVNSNPSIAADGVVVILQHNNMGGVRVEAERSSLKIVGDWKTVSLEPGWTHVPSNGIQARVANGTVEYRGFATNPTHTGGYTKAGTLPEGIPAPEREMVFPVTGNTAAIRSVRVTPSGEIQFYTSATTAAWYEVNSIRYGQ